MKVVKIISRQILDSRANPTVETDVLLNDGSLGRASVPSGASIGSHEALELRDNNPKFFDGKSVYKAVGNVNHQISKAIIGLDPLDQEKVDKILIELDGTENMSNLGANAILSVSLAVAKAAAKASKKQLYEYLGYLVGNFDGYKLPLPLINIINGGKHGGWGADIQEFMVIPASASTFSQAVQIGSEVFYALGKTLQEKGYPTSVGDEGGYAPIFKKGNLEAFEILNQAVLRAGYKVGKDILYALDVASSEFTINGKYNIKSEGKNLDTNEMISWLERLVKSYPMASLEDPLSEYDWDGWEDLSKRLSDKTLLVGDDLLVTNINFLEKAISKKAANSILIKLNQIGTLTQTIKAVEMARKAGWKAIISHRSGETEDTTIAHLAVGLSTGLIKCGSVSRTDRAAKYNELLRIEEILGNKAIFDTNQALKIPNI